MTSEPAHARSRLRRRAPRERTPLLGEPIFLLTVAAGLLTGMAVTTSRGATTAIVGFAALVVTGSLLDRRAAGVLVGLVALASCNAIPGIDLSGVSVGPALIWDLGGAVLVGVGAGTATRLDFRVTPVIRALLVWTALMGALWALATARGGLHAGLSVHNGDLLHLAVCPLAAAVILSNATTRRFAAWTLLVGFGGFAVAFIAAAAGAIPSDLVHAYGSYGISSFTRSYTVAQAGLPWVTFLALGLALTGPKEIRSVMVGVAAVGSIALFVTFTRMFYLGLALTIVIGVAVAGTVLGRKIGRRVLAAAAVLVLLLVIALPLAQDQPLVQTALSRFVSPSGQITDTDRTAVIRFRSTEAVIDRVGSSWLYGLGFKDPTTNQYEPDLPRGSLRNSDIGYMSAYGPLGLVGVLALVGLNLWSLARCFSATRVAARHRHGLDFGIAAGSTLWLLFTTLTAVTVAFFLRVQGAVVTSVFLALALTAAEAVRNDATASTVTDPTGRRP